MTPASGLSPAARRVVLVAFALSGVAGLVYEVVWARYLALLLGSGAYGQAAVLALYLGGMACGAFLAGRALPRLARPFRAYAGVESVLAMVALAFHSVFVAVGGAGDGGAALVMMPGWQGTATRLGLTLALVLPGALLAGATFPLLAAGLVRGDRSRPGGEVAAAYLSNALGGAGGVLLAGFVLVPSLGLPGALAVAAALNLVSAAAVAFVPERAPRGEPPTAAAAAQPGGPGTSSAPVPSGLLLAAAGLTAVASFGYEVAWVRLLALVLGSATHAFELMLSAFILGLALGAFLVAPLADRAPAPLRLLGRVQVLMGVAAVATLPLYAGSFDAVAYLVSALSATEGGYALFHLSRYGLALLVMVPATTLAGMTLPLLIGTLLRAGTGEETIARAYGWNTLGAVAGVLLAALVVLPVAGVRGLLAGAAVLDVMVGVALLQAAARTGEGRRGSPWVALALGAGLCLAAVRFPLDPVTLSSAAFRYGSLPEAGTREMLYYRDGRTATVAAYRNVVSGRVTLATNGKPDASLDPPLLGERRDTVLPYPLAEDGDAATQILLPLVGLAHAPGARRVANVGHGSGMSATALLTGPRVEEVLTLEIEPAMVEGSKVFLPANRAALEDPRSRVVLGDARILLSVETGTFDLIVSEPSNPWVSGNAGLFTREFYRRARGALAPGGVLAQWIQLYEVDDALVLSVVAAMAESFPHYRVYLAGDRDVVVVARADGALPSPDWRVVATPAARVLLAGLPEPTPATLEALLLLEDGLAGPLLAGVPRVNSDFHPVLEYGAERSRFHRRTAEGILGLGQGRWNLARAALGGGVVPPGEAGPVFSRGLAPMVRFGRAGWLHRRLRQDSLLTPPPGFATWEEDARRVAAFEASLGGPAPAVAWSRWGGTFSDVEALLHAGTWRWVDGVFYDRVEEALARWNAPPGTRAAVTLLRGVATGGWAEAATAADALGRATAGGAPPPVPPATLLEASVLAWVGVGRLEDARAVLEVPGAPLDPVRRSVLLGWVEARRRGALP